MERARALFPGGVSSPVRAFRGVGGEPFVVERGEGSRIWDVDGNEYIDYVLSWGAARARPRAAGRARRARATTMRRGTSFGIPTELEVELARVDRRAHAARRDAAVRLERHRGDDERDSRSRARRRSATSFSSSTAAITDTPTRFSCARAPASRRSGLPNSPGVPDALAALTVVAPFNDLDAVESLLRAHRVAAIIVEPVVGNGGFIAPDPAFLPGLARARRSSTARCSSSTK